MDMNGFLAGEVLDSQPPRFSRNTTRKQGPNMIRWYLLHLQELRETNAIFINCSGVAGKTRICGR